MDYPEIIKIKFMPTHDMYWWRGYGIDTREKLIWDVSRDDGIYLISHHSDNWAIVRTRTDEAYPLVTAVMPTCRGREKMARYAVEQFLNQSWKEKELIIVNEGDYWITDGSDINIREVRVQPGCYRNGTLHNIGDGIARGQYIIRWDDDDIHHPDRIKIQAEAAIIHVAPCSTLGKRIHYFMDDDIAFVKETSSCGLILYENKGNQYLDGIRGGTDEIFYKEHYQSTTIKLDNWPGIYVRIYHGINQICNRNHCMAGNSHLQPGEWEVGDCEDYLRSEIKKYREAIK